jgi:small-conductance mechanosensitive channel
VIDLHLLDAVWYRNSLRQWLIAFAVLGTLYVVLSVARRVAIRRLGVIAARSATQVDDLAIEMVRRTREYFLFGVALYAAARLLVLTAQAQGALHLIMVALVLLQAGRWGNGLIAFGVEHYLRRGGDADPGARATVQAVGYAGRFVLGTILLIMALAAFGIDVTALITGLGVGGIAIALAVQNILGDLFAALAIVLDKPFVVGESIQMDDINGTVEHIGLKTTRLRSVGGEQIVVSNADLLRSRIRNYKRMQHRRVVFHVDVTYDTAPEVVDGLPGVIRGVIERQALTRFERSHFLTFAESALRLETVYWILDADYTRYADTHHAINIELLKRFAAAGVELAYPSRTVIVRGPGDAGREVVAAGGA